MLIPRNCSLHAEGNNYREQRKAEKYSFFREIKEQLTGIANKYNFKPQ